MWAVCKTVPSFFFLKISCSSVFLKRRNLHLACILELQEGGWEHAASNLPGTIAGQDARSNI